MIIVVWKRGKEVDARRQTRSEKGCIGEVARDERTPRTGKSAGRDTMAKVSSVSCT